MTSLYHKIHHSRINLLKFLDATGFDVQPYKDTDLATIHQMCASQHAGLLNMVLYKKGHSHSAAAAHEPAPPEDAEGAKDDPVVNPRTRAFVYYHMPKTQNTTKTTTFKPPNLYELIDVYKIEQNMQTVDSLTVVIMHDVNDTMHKTLSQIWENDRVFVNVFSITQLQFCILEHTFVPKHIPLSDQEKADVYREYYVRNDSDLPEISRFDAVAKAVALRPGQLCMIERPDRNAVVTKFYRRCV